jgi:hypothetical protein
MKKVMTMEKIICKNCGKELILEGANTFIFCSACGTKNEIKVELNENDVNKNKDMLIKFKANLHNAYIGRNINEIMEYAHKVMDLEPNDFLANFLVAFCNYKRGNSNKIIYFMANGSFEDASENEIDISLKEITSDRQLYNEKCKYIKRLQENGQDVDKYLFYLDVSLKNKTENKGKIEKLATTINNVSLLVSFVVLFVMGLVVNATFIFLAVAAGICGLLVIKKGFDKKMLIVLLILSIGLYPLTRLLVCGMLYSSYHEEYKCSLKQLFFTEGRD